jgi:phage shock protein A
MKRLIILLVFFLGISLSTASAKVATAVSNKPTLSNLAATNGQANTEHRLSEAKLKVCQNKQNAIQTRSNQLIEMADNMLTKFDQITLRVEQYYTATVVPGGKTVSNYDALIADIVNKKKAVQSDLNTVSAEAASFSCTDDDPKGQLTQFRIDMQQVKTDLKEFRTAIKNLIVAIRSLTGQTESSSSPSPSPSLSSSTSPSPSPENS